MLELLVVESTYAGRPCCVLISMVVHGALQGLNASSRIKPLFFNPCCTTNSIQLLLPSVTLCVLDDWLSLFIVCRLLRHERSRHSRRQRKPSISSKQQTLPQEEGTWLGQIQGEVAELDTVRSPEGHGQGRRQRHEHDEREQQQQQRLPRVGRLAAVARRLRRDRVRQLDRPRHGRLRREERYPRCFEQRRHAQARPSAYPRRRHEWLRYVNIVTVAFFAKIIFFLLNIDRDLLTASRAICF